MLKGKGKAKGDGVFKKLVKTTGRKWLAALIISGVIFLAVTLALMFLSSVFMTQIAGILGFELTPHDDVDTSTDECPCGCVLLGVNVRPDGNYGFGTGSLTANSLEAETIKLLYKLNSMESGNLRPYMIWTSLAVETGDGQSGKIANLYSSAPTSIYDDLMKVSDRAKTNCFNGDPVNNPVHNSGNVIMVGPFQIHEAYTVSWAAHLPDEVIQELGGVVPDFPSRSKEHPLYLPDVLYKKVSTCNDYINEGMDLVSSKFPDKWNQLSEDAKYYVGGMVYNIRYNKGNTNFASSHPVIFEFFMDLASAWDKNPEAIYAIEGGPINWSQNGTKDNKTMSAICDYLATTNGGKDYLSDYNSYENPGERQNGNNYKSQWLYAAKAFSLGMKNYESIIQASPGTSKGKFTSDAGAGAEINTGVTHNPNPQGTSTPIDWSTTAFIGDSLTVGLAANTEVGNLGAEINAGTSRALSLFSTGTPPDGVPATTVRDTKGKSTIIFTLGTNSAGSSEDSFRTAFNTVIDEVITNNPDATIYVNLLPPVDDDAASSWSSVRNEDILRCNAIIQEEAMGKGLTVIDGYTPLWDSGIENISADGIHLNQDGYNEWWGVIKGNARFGGGGSGDNPGDSGDPGGTPAGGTGVQDGAIWNCTCLVPCPYCSCHDDGNLPAGQNPGEGELATREFPQPAQGVASGLWGTTDELSQYIEDSGDNGISKDAMRDMLQYVGMAPKAYGTSTWIDYGVRAGGDKFKGPDGLGMICYHQGSYNGKGEVYNNIGYDSGGNNLTFSGCGFIAMANALSTLEKKWVNPAEVLIAMGTTSERGGYKSSVIVSSGAAYSNALAQVAQQAGYNAFWGGDADHGSIGFNQSEVDKVIDAGGLVVAVLKGKPVSSTDGSAHYIVIRDRLSNGNYVICNSLPEREFDTGPNGATAQQFTWTELDNSKGSGGDQVIYIYPKVGVGAGAAGGVGVVACQPFGQGVNYVYTSDIFRAGSGVDAGQCHGGVDIVPSPKQSAHNIVAVADGEVIASGRDGTYGNRVILQHGSGDQAWCTLYAHMRDNSLVVSEGDIVKAGDKLGIMGTTGRSTGEHLHIEFWPSNSSRPEGSIVVDGFSMLGGKSNGGTQGNGGENVFNLTKLLVKYGTPRSGTVKSQGSDYSQLVTRFSHIKSNVFIR